MSHQSRHRGGSTHDLVWVWILRTPLPPQTWLAATDAGVEEVGDRHSSAPLSLPATCLGPRERRPARTPALTHSPIFPLGFVDVTISASANFAALVFKQVLDPLPLAAQLHFKVIVHCHSLRVRRAGVGGPGDRVGDRVSTGSRSPREPARSTRSGRSTSPTDAAGAAGGPARAPGTSREAAGQSPDEGWGGTERCPWTKESRRTRAGGGERVSLPLSPLAPGAPVLSPAARSAPTAGSGRVATADSPPLKRALTPHPLSHARSHSLIHSLILPYTQTERELRTTAGTSSERGGGRGLVEHGRGCRKNVAKA